ncbi:ParB/RepB/Spo0J family partition protein [Pseudomonas sp. NPDC096950]|uniref:ParB/RepB/Spo0J family partition protein n=1 Tax=Pseudomonas sp. NPDC096950 TaxID=3364485 RepID=UPI00383A263C
MSSDTPPAPVTAPRGRRELGTSFDNDPQASGAAKMLRDIEDGASLPLTPDERFEPHYDLSIVKPSPNNPRRISLDRAGVSDERIRSLIHLPGESYERWANRIDTFSDSLHVNGTPPSAIATWEELFELAVSILRNGVLQPIVIRPDNIIIAGERRWVASMLAGKPFGPVLIKKTSDQQAAKLRLIENIHREDLSLEEKVLSCRAIMLIETGMALGPDNPGLTMEAIQNSIGCRHTQSSYYSSMCKLPDGDPLLERMMSGEFTSLKAAYAEASKRVRQLSAPPGSQQLPAPGGDGQDPDSNAPKTPQPPKPGAPQAKIRMPGTAGGQKFLAVLKKMDGLPPEIVTQLEKTSNAWTGAPEKVRKKMLIDTLESLFAAIDSEE